MLKLTVKEFLKKQEFQTLVMPNELLVLDANDSTSTNDIFTAVRRGSQVTKRVSLLADFPHLKKYSEERILSFLRSLQEQGLYGLHLYQKLDVPAYSYSGMDQESPYLVKIYNDVRWLNREVPTLKVVPLFECPADQTHHLGPLITYLAKGSSDCEEVLLQPPPLRTKENVESYQQLFEYLKLRDVRNLWISFSYFESNYKVWNIQTFNSFSGPEIVHFDISNKCTHSCHFCGIYGPDAIEGLKGLSQNSKSNMLRYMSATLDRDRGFEILESLPESVVSMQFGGAGDPMTHPNFMDFLRVARARGIHCEVLSNMDYFDERMIEEMTALGSSQPHTGIHFIANVSGATEEMYLKTRPRQTAKNYKNVMTTLERLTAERKKRNGHGVYFTMMCVMTRVNYVEAAEYIRMADRIGAWQVYLKPMELHTEHQRRWMIDESLEKDYARHLRAAMEAFKETNLSWMCREDAVRVIEKNYGGN